MRLVGTDRVYDLRLSAVGQRHHLRILLVDRVYLYDGHCAVGVVDCLHHRLCREVGDSLRLVVVVVVMVTVMMVVGKVGNEVLTAVVLVAVPHDGA